LLEAAEIGHEGAGRTAESAMRPVRDKGVKK
jgi:hypothetical protein